MENSGIPFSLMGASPGLYGTYNSIDFYTSGLTPTGNIESITLYISGSNSQSVSLPLYLEGHGSQGDLTCYIEGYFTDSDFPLVGGSGLRDYIPLCVYGTGNGSSTPTLSTPISDYLTCYLYGSGVPTSGGLTIMVHGLDSLAAGLSLSASGVSGYNSNSMPLYMYAKELLSSGLSLVARGY